MRHRTLIAVGLAAVLWNCTTVPVAVPRTWALPPEAKTLPVNGYEMAYVERGRGVPVVLVHGSGIDYRFFAAQMEPMAAKYRAIAVSVRHAWPEPWRGEGAFTMNQHAADLAEFIRRLDAGPVHLVGHSRGGTVAIYAARLQPGLVRSLTIAEGGGGMAAFAPSDPAAVARRSAAFRGVRDKFKSGELDTGLELFQEYVNGPGAWKNLPDRSKQFMRDNAWTLVAADSDGSAWAPFTCEDAKQLSQIMPVFLLGGETSPKNFGAILDRVQACMPRATRGLVKNSSHSMPRMNPAGFNEAVLSFIDRH
ncbi:MAG: alpha/beta hydrolase [Burkholderiales bacterium]|nr:alpha/beta hydrolase [Burkholderiales bacterium]